MLPKEHSSIDPPTRAQWFTTTHWTVILNAGNNSTPEAAAALEKLCQAYWYPLYAYIRRQGNDPHDAQDLTQEFFARLLARNSLGAVERDRGKFRSFLLGSVNHFLANERDRASALKRGGGQELISLDEVTAEGLLAAEVASNLSPEKSFERRWVVTLLDQAFARVRREFVAAGKEGIFERLKNFLADRSHSGDYAAVASEMGLSVNTVAVTVHRLRQRYRELVREEVAHTVSSPAEIDEEMRHLLSVLAH